MDIKKLRKGLLDTTHIKTDINSGKFQGDTELNCMDLTALATESKELGLINTSIKLLKEAYAAWAEEEEEEGAPADPVQVNYMDKLREGENITI